MQLTVKGYRGIDRAEIEIPENQITLIAGDNMAGKTSLVQAIQYNAKGDAFPLGLDKKEMKDVIFEGTDKCEVSLKTERGTRTLMLPACEIKGTAIDASEIAVGLRQIALLEPDDLADLLTKKLVVTLDSERLAKELSELNTTTDTKLREDLQKILLETVFGTDKIPAKGWDSGEKSAGENSRSMQSQWATITGEKWGVNKGEKFTPRGWDPDLANANQDDLISAVTKAREGQERAIAQNAIGEAELETLKTGASKLEKFNERLDEIKKAKAVAANVVIVAEQALAAAKAVTTLIVCSGCGLHGQIVENDKMKRKELKAVEIQKVPDLKKCEEALADAKKAYDNEVSALSQLEQQVKWAQEATDKLKNAVVGAPDDKRNDADQALATAQIRLEAFTVKQKAFKVHEQIVLLNKAKELLCATGLRRRALLSQLENFNTQLSQLSQLAGWQTKHGQPAMVSIDKDLVVRYGGRHYRALSESEQYKCNATLQIAIAHFYEDAPVIIFDRAELLARSGRNQLINLLVSVKRTAVIALMLLDRLVDGKLIDAKTEAPKLRPPIGVTYWVDGGVIEKLEVQQAVSA